MIRLANRRDERRPRAAACSRRARRARPRGRRASRRSRGRAPRGPGSRRAAKTRGLDPGAARPLERLRVRLVRADRDDLDPSRPWSWSRIACRLVPAPEASTPTLTAGAHAHAARAVSAQLREPPAGRAQHAAVDQRVDLAQQIVGAPVVEVAVAGQLVVAVLAHDLAAPAAQDLDRARPPDARLRLAHHGEDRLLDRRRSPLAARPRVRSAAERRVAQRASGPSQTSQHRPAASGSTRSPKCRRIARRRHVSPSTNPQTSRYWRQRWFFASGSSTWLMKNTCRPLSRFSASSTQRDGEAVAPARPASW